MPNLAKDLRKLRKSKKFSQEKLARLSNVANNTIIKIEVGENKNPTLGALKKIAEALNISADYLIQ